MHTQRCRPISSHTCTVHTHALPVTHNMAAACTLRARHTTAACTLHMLKTLITAASTLNSEPRGASLFPRHHPTSCSITHSSRNRPLRTTELHVLCLNARMQHKPQK